MDSFSAKTRALVDIGHELGYERLGLAHEHLVARALYTYLDKVLV